MIEITKQEINATKLLEAIGDPDAGANVLFLGTTRRMTGDVETTELNYDCYTEMAEKKLHELETQARQRWPLKSMIIVHRVGNVPVGQASVAVAVSSPHRAEAFDSARWIIDTLKQVVPIWKQEILSDGRATWVHPGTEMQSKGEI